MALIAKNTKTGGGTGIAAGQVFNAADLNTDMDTAFNAINGNLDNANIATGAAIAYAKLNLSGADLLIDARAVLLGGQRGLHRTTNGYYLLMLLRRSYLD